MLTGLHLINGQWIRSAGASFDAHNPATGEKLSPQFSEADEPEVDAALTSAKDAFEQCRDLPHGWQAKLLDTIFTKIMDLGDALLERAEQETALALPRLINERGRTCNQLKMFAEMVREGSWVDAAIETADPNRTGAPKPDLRRMSVARGPVVVFGASNFPFAYSVCGGDTASALAAGCPVIAKGHPSHPGTSEMFASAVLAALSDLSFPLGVFAMVQGRSNELGAALVKHPFTHAVGFTGSQKGGRALFDLAAARPVPIPVYAEMGSLNPLVVTAGAISERSTSIADGLANSITLGAGQFCTKPGIILAIGDEKLVFAQALGARIGRTQNFTMLSASLRDQFQRVIDKFAASDDVNHMQGSDEKIGFASASPNLFQTDAEVWLRTSSLREEAFGPAAIVVNCKNADEAIACLDCIGGSLTGSIHLDKTDAEVDIKRLTRKLESIAGRVIVNGYPTGVEVNTAIVHGGPYPATTDPGTTSVGPPAIRRFTRLIAYQDTPPSILPPELRDENPLGISRQVNGKLFPLIGGYAKNPEPHCHHEVLRRI